MTAGRRPAVSHTLYRCGAAPTCASVPPQDTVTAARGSGGPRRTALRRRTHRLADSIPSCRDLKRRRRPGPHAGKGARCFGAQARTCEHRTLSGPAGRCRAGAGCLAAPLRAAPKRCHRFAAAHGPDPYPSPGSIERRPQSQAQTGAGPGARRRSAPSRSPAEGRAGRPSDGRQAPAGLTGPDHDLC